MPKGLNLWKNSKKLEKTLNTINMSKRNKPKLQPILVNNQKPSEIKILVLK